MQIKITERALFARVARRLAHDGLWLRRCSERSRSFHNLARYYCSDRGNYVKGPMFDDVDELLVWAIENNIAQPETQIA